jgi:GH43 family beta-xylosidase
MYSIQSVNCFVKPGRASYNPSPNEPLEKTPYARTVNARLSSNEGSEQLTNPITDQTFLIYSAGRSGSRNYCLRQLELVGADSVNAQDWCKNNEGCQNVLDKAYGVGHTSFTTSPDWTEDWIVYHRMRDPVIGWAARSIRTQQFGWSDDGSPTFPWPG